VINGYDTVVLKMVMEPVLSCGSYRQGETPKPCDIFINFNCTLSQPVDGYVAVDIIKKNTSGPTYPALEGGESEAGLTLNIAPNTTRFTYSSSFRNNNNIMVAANRFSIRKVTFYRKFN
jgi:hypothetical protein